MGHCVDTNLLSCSDACLGSAGGLTPLCERKRVGDDERRDLDVSDSTSASATRQKSACMPVSRHLSPSDGGRVALSLRRRCDGQIQPGCRDGRRSLPTGRAPRRLAGGARVLRRDHDCAGSGLLWGQHDLVGAEDRQPPNGRHLGPRRRRPSTTARAGPPDRGVRSPGPMASHNAKTSCGQDREARIWRGGGKSHPRGTGACSDRAPGLVETQAPSGSSRTRLACVRV